jgi:hypothetical protein
MLKLEFVVHDEMWPQLTMTVTRESFRTGRVVQQDKKQYDLALGKAEEMMNNNLRFVIQEIIARHKTTPAPQGQ